MFSSNRIMSDFIVDLADVSAYGCDPMSFEDLREEFEGIFSRDDEPEGLLNM